MRRSLVRLVVGSVLFSWILAFVVVLTYSLRQSWTEDKARSDGVFLAYELLQQESVHARDARLRQLQPHSAVVLSLTTLDEVERRIGRSVQPGDQIPYRPSPQEHWFFLAFKDGSGALAAGPVHPAKPPGIVPIGLILAIGLLPVLAGLIAFRVERGIAKVEQASRTLATGELGTRITDAQGPSTELAATFNEMAERVQGLMRSRDELVQAVSHELGSPLSRLRFHVELLASEPAEQQQDRIGGIARELDALDELVAELLSYVQSDDVEVEKQEFDPKQPLSDLVELARLAAPQDRNVQVELALPQTCSMRADPRLFQRAVENLLRNAVRYARTQVLLELVLQGEDVRIVVHDDGPGIAEGLRDKVLTPFFRIEPDRGRTTGGSGLGLAIVARIIQRHAGDLEIADSPLGGAQVSTVWPGGERKEAVLPRERSAHPVL